MNRRPSAARRRPKASFRQRHLQRWQQLRQVWQDVRPLLSKLGVLAIVLVFGLAGMRVYQWTQRPTTLPFKHVQVRGEIDRIDTERLRATLAENVKAGFFSQDLAVLQRKLEALPWVHRVALRRIWPNRLLVVLEEQHPIARWGESGLLNRHGEVFAVALAEIPQTLPKISGRPGREHELIQEFIVADQILQGLGLSLVELQEDARLDQRLVLREGMHLALGRKNRQERLQRFAEVYRSTLSPFIARIAGLDLRYANGFAVRWREQDAALRAMGKQHGSPNNV
ncbi:MAG: cell division protein FtsQ/DivIB [Thiotrichales bacterium]